jgi:serine O-acetyltransferase
MFYKYKCRVFNIEIPLNCIREGLLIWHLNKIIINDHCKIGKGVSISAGVTVGHRKGIMPQIGNFVVLTIDAKVLGAKIADHVVIGAGAVQIKNVVQEYSAWAGVPARMVSNNYPESHFKREEKLKHIMGSDL